MTEAVPRKVVENIVKYRKRFRLTQKELADMLKVTSNVISDIECRRISVSIKMLFKMADAFGIDIDYLLEGAVKYKPVCEPLNFNKKNHQKLYDELKCANVNLKEQMLNIAMQLHKVV